MIRVIIFWFAIGCILGLLATRRTPEPNSLPKGYGQTPIYFQEPAAINQYRFDI